MLLIGDSMMGGSLGGAITRALAPNPRLRVVQASQNGTGLSRPDVFDWMKVVPPLLEREQPRFVVVSLGANDGQTLRLAGKPIAFGDPLWEKVYRARAVKMMRSLTATGARVLWLGLPPMRNSRFSSRIETLNRLFQQAAQRVSGVEYLELGMVVAGPGGDYSTFATDEDGRLVRMRMEDGIHYSPAGARAVTRWIVDWLRERQLLAAAR